MSAVSKNPFAMLDEDEGDESAPAPAPVKKEDASRKKDPPKKETAKADPAPSASGKPQNSSKGGGKEGGGKKGGKRDYERHSGTGRGRAADGHENKRGGAGKGNWGTPGDGTTPRDEAEDTKEMTEEEKAAAELAAEEKRKEEAAMTLEEWKKQQAEKASESLAAKPMREADQIDMKGLKLKEDDNEVFEIKLGDDAGKKGKKTSGRASKSQVLTDLNFTTASNETASPGRGDASCPLSVIS